MVVYIREIYYPEGFAFPLKEMSPLLAVTGTVTGVGHDGDAGGRGGPCRETVCRCRSMVHLRLRGVGYFLLCVPLYSPGVAALLLTWDILFLLPVMWVGPVLAPVLNSITMILLAAVIVTASEKHEKIRLKGIEWLLLTGGSAINDHRIYDSTICTSRGPEFSFIELVSFSDYQEVLAYSSGYVPVTFQLVDLRNWGSFCSSLQ
ncbi:MAG: hypothetical protein MZV70_67060 [Desulfobacterales bacterium]|nr:hypothetical protein [Desulfobacterales bacterium]